MEITKKVLNQHSNKRLDKASSEIFSDFSRSQLKKWIQEGRVLLNNEIASPKDYVYEDDEIMVNPISENKISWDPEKIKFKVIYENDDFIIVDKPCDLVMHPGAGCFDGTLANGLIFIYPELKKIPRAGIVHRLDKNTTGILLIARTLKFRNYYVNLLQERKVIKKYKAIVVGKINSSFEINQPIARDKKNRTKMTIRQDGKEALTYVRLEKTFNNYSLLDISIKTGRTHQIRVHLNYKQHPIIGDKTYNPANNIAKSTPSDLANVIRSFPRQALHSYYLGFQDMNNDKLIEFESEMPNDMKNLITNFKKHL